jgi:NAD(P)-dependent dehydrogenase (short-subunit alcohol dehydrogenase family)
MSNPQLHQPHSRIALITGANQGLGFALAEGLATGLAAGDVVYLTGRDRARVEDAAARIADPLAEVRPRMMDVRDGRAVQSLADAIRSEHGAIDIVFSNHYRRVLPGDEPAEVIRDYVDTNNLGTTRVLRAFAPILRPGGRLVVVASSLGTLVELPPELRDRFDAASGLDEVDDVITAWREAVLAGRADAESWPRFINIPSKVGQVAAMRTLARARRADDENRGTLIVAVCPGMVDTGASRPWFDMTGAQTPAQAAEALLELALDPTPDPKLYGELIRFGEIVPWNEPEREALASRIVSPSSEAELGRGHGVGSAGR